MQLCVSHNNMDFDSLAAQFAVTKLHANARMALGYPIVGNIKEFLTLYRSNLPIVQLKYVELESVSHIFVVDCQHVERLHPSIQKLIEKGIPVTVFDHHELDPNGLGAKAHRGSLIEPVGAATTLLVEKIIEKKIELTPFEATLLAIGIYEDTGALSYQGTSYRDATCAGHLLKARADLNLVNEYIRPKLSDEQFDLFQTLVRNSEMIEIAGRKIALAQAELPEFLDGLATMTRKLLELEAVDAAFVMASMRDRVHIVGRSDNAAIDVRDVVRAFGGDGHRGAGSAVTKDESLKQVALKVRSVLNQHVKAEAMAKDIMLSPVKTIDAETTMDEANQFMIRYGVDGIIITAGKEVIGVVSRRDVDQALHHRLGHAKVSGFMSHPVLSIKPETSLSEIQSLMVRNDIGRLPVLDDGGHILGLVSRQEVLKHSLSKQGIQSEDFVLGPFGARLPGKVDISQSSGKANLSKNGKGVLSTLDEDTLKLFKEIGDVAQKNKMTAYAVGGMLRDLLLERPSFDLDFVIEGSAPALAQKLVEAYPQKFAIEATHDRFQTARLTLLEGERGVVDLSTARTEFYEFPAALPTVEPSKLEQDLFRRDFTINAMAVSIVPNNFGEIFDYFNGLDDLHSSLIRILHQFSFIEDPTRLLRAARFAARFEFKLEKNTREQAKRAITIGIFDNLGGSRLKKELKLLLEEPGRRRALELLSELGGKLRYLDEHLEYGQAERKAIRRCEKLVAGFSDPVNWAIFLALLLSSLTPEQLEPALTRLYLSNEERNIVLSGLALLPKLADIDQNAKPSEIYEVLHGESDEALIIAVCLAPDDSAGKAVRRMARLYTEELRKVVPETSGQDLLGLGFAQGPKLGQALKSLLVAKLNGQVTTKHEELEFVKKFAVAEP